MQKNHFFKLSQSLLILISIFISSISFAQTQSEVYDFGTATETQSSGSKSGNLSSFRIQGNADSDSNDSPIILDNFHTISQSYLPSPWEETFLNDVLPPFWSTDDSEFVATGWFIAEGSQIIPNGTGKYLNKQI